MEVTLKSQYSLLVEIIGTVFPSSSVVSSNNGPFWLQKQDGDDRDAKLPPSKLYTPVGPVFKIQPQLNLCSGINTQRNKCNFNAQHNRAATHSL